jgi:transcriptional regulator with XRE-family HTH domain
MQDKFQSPSGDDSHNTVNQPGLAELAAALRSNRKRLGLTQIQVAEKLGISQSFLSKLENAKAEPTALQWLRFCEITQIDPSCVLKAIQSSRMESMSVAPQPMIAKSLTA